MNSMQPLFSSNKGILSSEAAGLLSIFICSSIVTYLRSATIEGPSIFWDEAIYFDLGRTISFSHNYGGHTQYNPLYPLLISPFFKLETYIDVYQAIRIINPILFSTIIFPIFWTAKEFLEKRLAYLFSILVILLPFSAITPMVWAEPLFYSLYAWCIYLFIRFIKVLNHHTGAALGLALGLLFLSKQSALILIFSIYLSLLYYLLIAHNRSELIRKTITVTLSMSALIAPWLARNICTPNAGLLGYKEEVGSFASTDIFDEKFLSAVLYQVSYLGISTFFLGIILFYLLLLYIDKLSKEDKVIYVMLNITVPGLVLLCALHRYIAENSFNLPYGRYLSVLLPYIFIFGTYSLKYIKVNSRGVWICSGILCTLMTFCSIRFPPTETLGYYSAINNFDISYFNFIFGDALGGESINLCFYHILLSVFIILSIICIRYGRKPTILLISLLVLLSGCAASHCVNRVANSQRTANRTYKYMLVHPEEEYVFDGMMPFQNFSYLNLFWFGPGQNHPILRDRLFLSKSEISIRFGSMKKESGSDVKLYAPWDGEAAYRRKAGLGFRNIEKMDSGFMRSGEKENDFIFGWVENTFELDVSMGDYAVVITYPVAWSHPSPIRFDMTINGSRGYDASLDGQTSIIRMNLRTNGPLMMDLLPEQNCLWALSEIRLIKKGSIAISNAIFVTEAEMALERIASFGEYRLYRVQ